MKKSRFSDEQIVQILREADSAPIAEVAERREVSEDVKRLKALKVESSRLNKLVTERDLEIEVIKEIAVKKW